MEIDSSLAWLEKEASIARDRIASIEVAGVRWLSGDVRAHMEDVTAALLRETKERLAQIEEQLSKRREGNNDA